MPLQSIISQNSNARLKVEKYIDHTIDQITSRTIGKDPLSSINMWVGDPSLTTLQRSSLLWADDLRSQLTGHPSYKSGGWGQGAGGVAITRRHLLNCGHWGLSYVGITVTFIKDGGGGIDEYFQTTIINNYTDPPPNSMTFEGNTYDLQVFLTADELPEWVNVFTIIQFESKYTPYIPSEQSKVSGKLLPTISISQGINPGSTNPQKLYIGNNWSYQIYDTIANDGFVFGKRHTSPDIHPYYYSVFIGDSGTPAFTLIDNTLYLFGIVTGGEYGVHAIYLSSHVSFINELIRRVDLDEGINTGYTVATQSFDALQF